MNIQYLRAAVSSLGLVALVSCITVNIYFPEAAVKKAAEEIVNEIREKEVQEEPKKEEEIKSQSFAWVPAAFAQEETTVSSPGIRALKQSLKQRFLQLAPFFDRGLLGESNDGLVQIKNESQLPLAEKAALRNLVKDENADRQALYAEVAKALSIDAGQIPRIRKIFADLWAQNSKPGWWIQKPEGDWVKKPA